MWRAERGLPNTDDEEDYDDGASNGRPRSLMSYAGLQEWAQDLAPASSELFSGAGEYSGSLRGSPNGSPPTLIPVATAPVDDSVVDLIMEEAIPGPPRQD